MRCGVLDTSPPPPNHPPPPPLVPPHPPRSTYPTHHHLHNHHHHQLHNHPSATGSACSSKPTNTPSFHFRPLPAPILSPRLTQPRHHRGPPTSRRRIRPRPLPSTRPPPDPTTRTLISILFIRATPPCALSHPLDLPTLTPPHHYIHHPRTLPTHFVSCIHPTFTPIHRHSSNNIPPPPPHPPHTTTTSPPATTTITTPPPPLLSPTSTTSIPAEFQLRSTSELVPSRSGDAPQRRLERK